MGILTTSVAILLGGVGLQPPEVVVEDHVDLIEVNHFYDEHGKLVFDQVIFYDWSALQSRYHVRAWRLLKCPAQVPRRNWRRREFETVWHDVDILRRASAKSVRETWAQHDPELLEREFLPREKRRELRRLKVGENGK